MNRTKLSPSRGAVRALAATAALLLAFAATKPSTAVAQPPAAQAPMVKQNSRTKVSDHVYVILDDNVGLVPNVGLVVGSHSTLIVDTGLGERNGKIIHDEATKASANTDFYLTATHFHPEHDLGATAFPASAKMLRWRGQQIEADEDGATTIERFKSFSAAVADLLGGARFRAPDVLFDDAITVDLGGVHVKMWGVGPNHTRGDTAFFVEEDRVLFTGDTVMAVLPAASGTGSIVQWQKNLNAYEALKPGVVVPAHGKLIDAATIKRYREYFTAIETRVATAKRGGASVEATQKQLAEGLAKEFADLAPQGGGGGAVGRINAAIQAAYREAP